MGQVRFGAIPIENNQWVPNIVIEEDGEQAIFILDRSFSTQDEAGEFIKWFHGLLSDKSKQKNFIFSKSGMSTNEMRKALEP